VKLCNSHRVLNAFALLALGVFELGIVEADTIRVPLDQPSIQDAINSAVNGDNVLVAPGTYNENINFSGKAIAVASEQGPKITIINGISGSVVTFDSGEGASSRLKGFTVQNGSASFGGGIGIWSSSPTIENNIITDNGGDGGSGAIWINAASPIIKNNLIQNNTAAGSGFLITAGIAMVNESSPLIENNIIINNLRGAGIVVMPSGLGAPQIVNNVISNNIGGGIKTAFSGDVTVTIKNNIITNNPGGAGIYTDFGTIPVVSFCNVWNNEAGNYGGILPDLTGTDGNISINPLFVDMANDDFHLMPSSPAIDAGTNEGAPPQDFDGNPRPEDGDGDGLAIVDMGAFEFALAIYDTIFADGFESPDPLLTCPCWNTYTEAELVVAINAQPPVELICQDETWEATMILDVAGFNPRLIAFAAPEEPEEPPFCEFEVGESGLVVHFLDTAMTSQCKQELSRLIPIIPGCL